MLILKTFVLQAFKFPLSITMTHLVTKFLMASLVRIIWKKCSGKSRITLGWSDDFKRIAPPGIEKDWFALTKAINVQ